MASVLTGAYQTSVDLVNATDGLSHVVAETILDTAFFSSVRIPRSLRALAKASLSPIFADRFGVLRRVRHGQMMGAYLSFPLLCLQSYCAASWAARFDPRATFLVNGDDAVISAERGITVQDYPSGFRLNSDKTIVATNVAEVNSTAFLRMGGRWCEVHHLRRGGAPTDYPGMLHMSEAVLKAGPGFVDAFQRSRIGRRWGFLPSQLGHWTYPSYKRQRAMLRSPGSRGFRFHTDLPTEATPQNEDGLRRICGDPDDRAAEALRASLWGTGRRTGLKRDVFSPSCGRIRRGYGYKAQPCWRFLSFVDRGGRGHASPPKKPGFFLVPDEFETDEEMLSLFKLELLRREYLAGLEAR